MLQDIPIIAHKISYKAGFKKIIDNISLVLRKNEFVGVIGGSGSGKTTLMTCLNGIRKISSGKVILNGEKISNTAEISKLIGYVPQDDIVHKSLSVERALYFSYLLRLNKDIPDKEVYQEVEKVLDLLDLKEHKNKKISSLSGGQRKRVSIGLELLHSPNIFFLDEPTAGLDPGLERQLMRLLADIANEQRVIMVSTHLMQNVDLFDVLIFMHKGKLIYCGPVNAIMPYFKVNNMFEIYDKVNEVEPSILYANYLQSSLYQGFIGKRLMEVANLL